MPHPTKVLIVEDSLVDLEILKMLLASSLEVKVVGTARNGKEALELIPKLQPAVICTDLHMKEMDGLEFTKQVMAKYPRPILVISYSVQKEDTDNILQLLSAGAVDIFPKPTTGLPSDYERVKLELINKIKILSGVTVFTKRQQQPTTTATGAQFSFQASTARRLIDITSPIRVVTIGASTGGPQALQTILTQLPLNFPVPVICTQHISEGFLQGLVDWLALECQLQIKIATVGESPLPGTIYFAPDRSHLELDPQGKFTYSMSPPIDGHRPSVTVTFKSVANFYGRATAGVLLTGMGRDGAEGMLAIAQAGGITIAQDEKSSVVFGMPSEAIALGAAQHILPIHEIAPLLLTKIFVNKS
jgi:two-component system chemotaxis response regulator CheB